MKFKKIIFFFLAILKVQHAQRQQRDRSTTLHSAWDIDTVYNRSGRRLEYVLYSSSRSIE
jgi:hypothetical protein